MKRLLCCFAIGACVWICGQWTATGACPPPVVPKESGDQVVPPAAQVRTLTKEFNGVAYEWRQVATDAERDALFARIEGIPLQMLELARSHPQDPVAIDALTQVISQEYWFTAYTDHPGWGQDSPQAAAIAILLRDHLSSDKLGDPCKRAQYGFRQECEDFLRTVMEESPHRDIRGMACLRLAEFLAARLEKLALLEHQPEVASRYEKIFGGEYMEKLISLDRTKAMQEAEALYVQAGERFGDVKNPDGDTVGGRARSVLYEIRNLAPGKTAPEMSGQDQDGVAFKLSDYRGKVVLIYFWSEY